MATRVGVRDLVASIEAKTGIKQNLSRNVIKALAEAIGDELAAGREVTLTGFVKFSHGYKPALKAGREVRDPSTGETKKAETGRPASITVKARALRTLQAAAPSPTSKAGKPIADAGKARAAAAAARKAEREAQA